MLLFVPDILKRSYATAAEGITMIDKKKTDFHKITRGLTEIESHYATDKNKQRMYRRYSK
jgi:hypothetical protein